MYYFFGYFWNFNMLIISLTGCRAWHWTPLSTNLSKGFYSPTLYVNDTVHLWRERMPFSEGSAVLLQEGLFTHTQFCILPLKKVYSLWIPLESKRGYVLTPFETTIFANQLTKRAAFRHVVSGEICWLKSCLRTMEQLRFLPERYNYLNLLIFVHVTLTPLLQPALRAGS